MKIRALQENLIKAVQDSLKFIPNKPQIPILACILLEAKKGKLHLRATDLSVSMHATIGCKVEEEGVVAVPGRVLGEFLSTLQSGPLEIYVDDGKLYIHSSRVRSSIATSEAKDFPQFPEDRGKQIKLKPQQLSSLLAFGGIAAGVDETRPMFSCLRFECGDDGLSVVATDGYRLSKKVENISTGAPAGVMVSARIMREIERILERVGGDEVVLSIAEESGQMFFRTEGYSLALRMMGGDYPNYRAIVPQESAVSVEILAHELLGAVKTAMVFSRDVSGIVTLRIDGKSMSVSSAAASGESTSDVDVKILKGSSGEISFNGKYLIDFLSAMKDEAVIFGMGEPLKPGIFTLPAQKNFYYVVMPFRVANA